MLESLIFSLSFFFVKKLVEKKKEVVGQIWIGAEKLRLFAVWTVLKQKHSLVV